MSQISKHLLRQASNWDMNSITLILIPKKGTISMANEKKRTQHPELTLLLFSPSHLSHFSIYTNHSSVKFRLTLLKSGPNKSKSLL